MSQIFVQWSLIMNPDDLKNLWINSRTWGWTFTVISACVWTFTFCAANITTVVHRVKWLGIFWKWPQQQQSSAAFRFDIFFHFRCYILAAKTIFVFQHLCNAAYWWVPSSSSWLLQIVVNVVSRSIVNNSIDIPNIKAHTEWSRWQNDSWHIQFILKWFTNLPFNFFIRSQMKHAKDSIPVPIFLGYHLLARTASRLNLFPDIHTLQQFVLYGEKTQWSWDMYFRIVSWDQPFEILSHTFSADLDTIFDICLARIKNNLNTAF